MRLGRRDRRADDDKLVREIITPEGIPLRFTLARAGDRAAAFVIDMIVQLAILFAVVLAISLAVGGRGEGSWLTAIAILLSFLLTSFYFPFFEVRWQGSTPGKRTCGIRVIDARGGQLETSAVLARNLVRELEVWTPLRFLLAPEVLWPGAPGWATVLAAAWTLVFMFLPLFNRDRLRVGDLIAGTRVVLQPKVVLLPDLVAEDAPAPAQAQVRAAPRAPAAHVFDDAQLSIYGIYELQVLEEALRGNPWDAGRAVALTTIAEKIRAKIRYTATVAPGEEERFLRDFYAALRAHLEQKMLFGHRREDKFSK
jgi:uncharacterized RDD family membrane protein YckC